MSVKERLVAFIKFKNISVRKFENTCGLSYGYVNNMRVSIQPDKVTNIAKQFPELNTGWLLTGEGEMLIKTSEENGTHLYIVPLLPIAAKGGSLNDFVVSARFDDCEKTISPIKGVDFAMRVAGDSMSPEFPSGCQILVKKINEKAFIEWGKTYVLDTCNGIVIKEIHKGDVENEILCVSINPDPKFSSFVVNFSDIYGMYKVIMCMLLK